MVFVAFRSFAVKAVVALTTLALAFSFPAAVAEDAAAPRFIVGFYEWPGLEEGDEYRGMRVVLTIASLRAAVVEGRDDTSAESFQDDANVRYVEPDVHVTGLVGFAPNDPRFGTQYGPQQVKADLAWDRTLGTTARTLCITDTGVRYTHEDIAGPRWLGGRDTINNDNDPADDHGHGTHVAGIAAATVHNAKGIAGIGNVGIKAVKLISSSDSSTAAALADGVRWCRDNGTHVTNSSWGGSSICSLTSVRDAFQYTSDGGLLNIAAAGNGNGGAIECPAVWPTVVAVTCTTSSKAGCSFSSRGPDAELTAPGNAILSTSGWTMSGTSCTASNTAYCTLSGTSMSSPHVAGVAALVWSYEPTTTAAQLRTILQQTAEDLGSAGRDNTFGYGLVNAQAALEALANEPLADAGPDIVTSDGDNDGTATVTLDGSASSDPDPGDSIVSYEWLENAAVIATGATATLPFALGVHEVTLRVTDTTARTDTDTVTVTVEPNRAPVPVAVPSCDDFNCTFTSAGSTDTDGTIVSYAWTFGDGGVASGPTAAHQYASPGTYFATLTATDNAGATGEDSIAVAVPTGPEIVDGRVDTVGDLAGPSWMDILEVDFTSDAQDLRLRMSVDDILPDQRTTAQVAYHVLFTPTYTVADPTWGGTVPPGATFMGLRAQAMYSPGRPDAPLASTLSSPVFQLHVLYREGSLNIFEPIATVTGSVNPTTNLVSWTIPRATLQDPPSGGVLGTTSANAVPAIGGLTTFGVGFGDQTGPGSNFVFA